MKIKEKMPKRIQHCHKESFNQNRGGYCDRKLFHSAYPPD